METGTEKSISNNNESKTKLIIKDAINNIEWDSTIPVIGLLLIIIVFSFASPYFLTPLNLMNILRQVSVMGVMAVGVTFVIITGEIDLSIANVMAFSGVVAGAVAIGGHMIPQPFPVWVAILAGLMVGLIFGLLSGYANGKIGVPSFMATLAVMYIVDGAMLRFSDARPLFGLPSELLWLGAGSIFNIPTIVIIFALVFIVSHIVLSKTVFGRMLYAIGGNIEATRISGVNVTKYKIMVLVICGMLAALAGLLMLGRVGSAQVTVGKELLLPPIAAVLLGGTSLFGGEGNMFRTLIGVLIMGIIVNGLNLLGVGADAQRIAIGVILFVAISINVLGKRNGKA